MTNLRSNAVAAALLLAFAPVCYANPNVKPHFIHGEIFSATYDGVSDDLLTAGLGKSGLQGAAPTVSAVPTAAELRRLAIYNNYRALVDPSTAGGYGVLYGPNVTNAGVATAGEGKIAGEEHLAFAGPASDEENVTLMVQIPDTFDSRNPCIVTATSSGSRGVYGAIGTAGDWGLKQGCAVAYNDKGTGTGAHNLQTNTVNLITGVRQDAAAAGTDSNFTAQLSDAERDEFNAATPNRFAYKHAHSGQNPEKDWDRDVLHSIRFAFYLLNQKFGEPEPLPVAQGQGSADHRHPRRAIHRGPGNHKCLWHPAGAEPRATVARLCFRSAVHFAHLRQCLRPVLGGR